MRNQQLTEMQRKNMEVATRLAQLTIENSKQTIAVIAALTDALCEQGLAVESRRTANDAENVGELSTEYRQQSAQKMLNSAKRIGEIGNDMRMGFAHLLTEYLASGDEELLEAFQSFFAVLPARSPAVIVPAYPAIHASAADFDGIQCPSTSACDDIGNSPAARLPAESAWQLKGESRAF